jgi:prepilin-type N-terminal cleavage/methylation domain-containing protein
MRPVSAEKTFAIPGTLGDRRRGAAPGRVRHTRRAVTLVEIMVVLSVASVVMGVAITMLHLLLRSERDHARAIRTTITLSRLTETFRADSHASETPTRVVSDAGAEGLILAGASGREVAYSAKEHVIQRVESASGVEEHRDLFHFPPGSKIRFELEESPPIARVVIDVASPRPESNPEQSSRGARRRTFSIEAVVGRDQRFARRTP